MKKKALVVDDSFIMRAVIKDIVESDPRIEVVAEAENGKIGLQKVKECKPDLILLDLEMPEMSGLDMLKRLLLLGKTKVVVISSVGQAGPHQALEARRRSMVPPRTAAPPMRPSTWSRRSPTRSSWARATPASASRRTGPSSSRPRPPRSSSKGSPPTATPFTSTPPRPRSRRPNHHRKVFRSGAVSTGFCFQVFRPGAPRTLTRRFCRLRVLV